MPYVGTVPTPSSKQAAFTVFQELGGSQGKPINEEQFCAGEWN